MGLGRASSRWLRVRKAKLGCIGWGCRILGAKLKALMRAPFRTRPLPRQFCFPACVHGECVAATAVINVCACQPGWTEAACAVRLVWRQGGAGWGGGTSMHLQGLTLTSFEPCPPKKSPFPPKKIPFPPQVPICNQGCNHGGWCKAPGVCECSGTGYKDIDCSKSEPQAEV
jgi:hypothetical protein